MSVHAALDKLRAAARDHLDVTLTNDEYGFILAEMDALRGINRAAHAERDDVERWMADENEKLWAAQGACSELYTQLLRLWFGPRPPGSTCRPRADEG